MHDAEPMPCTPAGCRTGDLSFARPGISPGDGEPVGGPARLRTMPNPAGVSAAEVRTFLLHDAGDWILFIPFFGLFLLLLPAFFVAALASGNVSGMLGIGAGFVGVCAGLRHMFRRVTLTLECNVLRLEATRSGSPSTVLSAINVDLSKVVSVQVPDCHSEEYPELTLQNSDGTTVRLKTELGMAETDELAAQVAAFAGVQVKPRGT